jgi:diguanylate cyclase (GGDEF)-like protein/PAS domain S-box-containing protein
MADAQQHDGIDEARWGARVRAFTDTLPIAILAVDPQGIVQRANEKVRQTLGFDPLELDGVAFSSLLTPESSHAPGVRGLFAPGPGASATLDVEMLRKDGSSVPVELAVNVMEAAAGDRYIVSISDISQRLAIEAALRASEERQRELLENASDIVYTHDLQGAFTYVNASGVRRYGYALDELLTMNIAQIVDPEHLPRARESIVRKIQGEERTEPYEVLTHDRAGTDVWVEVSTRVLRDADGRPSGVQGIARDLTERKQAEQRLRESEALYRQIYESHSAVRLVLDPETRVIVDANVAASEFYGYSREELIGMDVAKINTLPPESISQEMAQATAERRAVFNFRHRLKSGEIRDVEVFTGPIDMDGRRLLFSVIQDVTERRRAESLVASQRQMLEMIALGAALPDVMVAMTQFVESHAPGAMCSILLLSADGTQLKVAAAPNLPDEVNAATDGLIVGPAVGSCGTAAFRGEEVVVSDIAQDPLWADFKDLALRHGLRSCWSTPILSPAGGVLGTFAVYREDVHVPEQRERDVVEIATHIAGIAIERKRAERAVRSRAAETERLYKRLVKAHSELEDSQSRLEEKSVALAAALESERERARKDPLTGALNHAAITELMNEHLADPAVATLAIAMVDVDGLKAANDTYGHQTGDEVLMMVANALMRDGAVVGRYGGDEFVALLPHADRAAAEAYREQVMEGLSAASLTDAETGARINVVASIGLAIYPEEAEAVEDLIKLSDSAMYAARRQRAGIAGSGALSRSLGGDRAARMVGEIVPFLTSPGDLSEKMHLVAQRLSTGAGYDAVNFSLYPPDPRQGVVSNSYSSAENEVLRQLDAFAAAPAANMPVRDLLSRTHRPVIIDSIADSDLLSDDLKAVLAAAGIESGLIAPMLWQGEVVGALSVGSRRPAAFGPRDAQFIGAISTQVTAIVQTAALVEDLQSASSRLLQAHQATVLMLASAAEAHDSATGRHLSRVRAISEALALELGHDAEHGKEIGLAAVLHDIGKIRVPDYVLTSSTSLSDSEWMLMKQHTQWGGQFLASKPGFELAASVARSHHERWDGSGYPDGLAGEEIPEAAAIATVADGLDAMTNDRPYRHGRPVADAIEEIKAWSGRQFSPRVVAALVRLYERDALPGLGDETPGEREYAA